MPRSVPDDYKQYLQDCAEEIAKRLPDNHGFILLTFPFGQQVNARIGYVSNARREDAINALKEWLIKASGPEDWMRNIQ